MSTRYPLHSGIQGSKLLDTSSWFGITLWNQEHILRVII
jgi:hypothetical protein